MKKRQRTKSHDSGLSNELSFTKNKENMYETNKKIKKKSPQTDGLSNEFSFTKKHSFTDKKPRKNV